MDMYQAHRVGQFYDVSLDTCKNSIALTNIQKVTMNFIRMSYLKKFKALKRQSFTVKLFKNSMRINELEEFNP